MYDCDCCGRNVVPKKVPGYGYTCDPCLAEQTLREYPWRMSDEAFADYLAVYEKHAEVCTRAREMGPMKQ